MLHKVVKLSPGSLPFYACPRLEFRGLPKNIFVVPLRHLVRFALVKCQHIQNQRALSILQTALEEHDTVASVAPGTLDTPH